MLAPHHIRSIIFVPAISFIWPIKRNDDFLSNLLEKLSRFLIAPSERGQPQMVFAIGFLPSTRRCLRHTDCATVVGFIAEKHTPGQEERRILSRNEESIASLSSPPSGHLRRHQPFDHSSAEEEKKNRSHDFFFVATGYYLLLTHVVVPAAAATERTL